MHVENKIMGWHQGDFSLRGRPAYSLLVLFLGTFSDLTKQKKLFQICAQLEPTI